MAGSPQQGEVTAMKRSLVVAALAAASTVVVPLAAQAWAPGGHSYIALHTQKKAGLTDANASCNRVYGAMAVDLFNYDFSATGTALAALLHGEGNATAAEAWDVATGFGDVTPAELAFAYGFSSHNDGWGTDSVAHFASRTLDRSEGYVVQKARVLATLLPPQAVAVIGSERMPLVSHVLVEYAIDLVLAEAEPGLGAAMMQASSLLPGLRCAAPAPARVLVSTLAPHVATVVGDDLAEAVILQGDGAARQVALALGWALAQPTAETRRDGVAALVASLATGFLGPLPPELGPAELQALIAQILDAGKLVVAGDLLAEIEATTGRVNGKMSALGIAP
jgi:hypothetical protein